MLFEGIKFVIRKFLEGFNAELAIPIESVKSMGGEDWKTLRVNVAYYDRDGEELRSQIWWKPNWSSPKNYIGSGMFFREE